MQAIATRSAATLSTFNAQECSKLLYAMDKSQTRCAALERAAAAQREDRFVFDEPVGTLCLQHMKGGGRFARAGEREATGATAATGGALWDDSYALAEWLSRKLRGRPSSADLVRDASLTLCLASPHLFARSLPLSLSRSLSLTCTQTHTRV